MLIFLSQGIAVAKEYRRYSLAALNENVFTIGIAFYKEKPRLKLPKKCFSGLSRGLTKADE
jgi:hypothetical protein